MSDPRPHLVPFLGLVLVLAASAACSAVSLGGETTPSSNWRAMARAHDAHSVQYPTANPTANPAAPLGAPQAPRRDQGPVQSVEPVNDGWEWRVVPYVWAADLDGDTTVQGNDVDLDVPFSDTLDHLDSAAQMVIEARKGDWAVVLDNTYMVLSADGKVSAGTSIPAGTPVDVTMRMWLAGLVGLHRLAPDSPYELGLGARYAKVSNELDVGTSGARGSSDVLDGVLAGRARWPLDERWTLALYGDAGAGDSDFTWQSAATFFRQFDGFALGLGYRVLHYDFAGSRDSDLTFSGFTLGADFRF